MIHYIDEYIHSGDFYDIVNDNKTEDISFYIEICKQYGGNVCEACCGTGRITIPLALSGIDIVGFDKSESMITKAREKAAIRGVKVPFWISELREDICTDRFDIVICPFNSLQDFYDFSQIKTAFRSISQLLKDNAVLCFDVFNPKISKLSNCLSGSFIEKREINDHISILEESTYNTADQVIRTIWKIHDHGHLIRECVLDSRCYFPQELDNLLKFFGYRVENKWGDFNKTPFTSDSPKQVIVARKCN